MPSYSYKQKPHARRNSIELFKMDLQSIQLDLSTLGQACNLLDAIGNIDKNSDFYDDTLAVAFLNIKEKVFAYVDRVRTALARLSCEMDEFHNAQDWRFRSALILVAQSLHSQDKSYDGTYKLLAEAYEYLEKALDSFTPEPEPTPQTFEDHIEEFDNARV